MSTLFVDTINEKTSGNGVQIPGHVLQVVHTTMTTNTTISSSSFAAITGASLAITPKSSSSKILISWCNHVYVDSDPANNWKGMLVRLKRGSTVLSTDGTGYGEGANFGADNDRYMTYSSSIYLDSPSTTSATTYSLEAASKYNGGNGVYINNSGYGRGGTITLMEIAQ